MPTANTATRTAAVSPPVLPPAKTKATKAATATDTGNGTGAEASVKRTRKVPDIVLSWTPDRDRALMALLKSRPAGTISAKTAAQQLATNPAFEGVSEVMVEDPNKLRLRVAKLNEKIVALGYPALEFARSSNRDYDPSTVIEELFAGGEEGVEGEDEVDTDDADATEAGAVETGGVQLIGV